MTLTEMITNVKAFGYGSEDDTTITAYLNLAYSDVMSRYKWRWTESSTTVATTANIESTSLLVSSFIFVGDLMSLSSNVPTPVYVDNESQIDDLHRDLGALATDRGKPTVYTITGNLIRWFPVPDAVYSYRLYTWNAPLPLSGGSDQPAFNTAFHQVLVEGALMHMSSRDHNSARVQEHKDRYEQLITLMAMKDRFRNSGSSHLFLPKSYGGMYDIK